MVDDIREPIRFSAGFNAGLETRAFLNSDDISGSTTEFTIYGYNGSNWFIDGNGVSGIDASTVKTNRKLTVSAKAFDFVTTDNDFDFCYSDIVYRPSTKVDHSDVKFNLNQLFTGIAFSTHILFGMTELPEDGTIFVRMNGIEPVDKTVLHIPSATMSSTARV